MSGVILTLNAGSSSIKFAAYRAGANPVLEASGLVDDTVGGKHVGRSAHFGCPLVQFFRGHVQFYQ